MARNNDRDRGTRRAPKETTRRGKKKVCIFCKEHIAWVDYKEVGLLRKFMSDRGKIRARRVSGNCAQHQRDVALAIKTARELALLPYTQRTTSDRPGPRGPGRGGDRRIPTPDAPGAPEADDVATLVDDADEDDEVFDVEDLVPATAGEDE
jgi:small subunit ribosomal protein S18